MVPGRVVIIVMVLFLTIPSYAMAGAQITWVDNDILGSQSIIIKSSNGTILGTYNTTSDLIQLSDNETYIFQLRPKRTDYIRAPAAFLTELIEYTADNAIPLVFIGFLAVLVLAGVRRK